jgi:exopolysaccharide production protein ExoY
MTVFSDESGGIAFRDSVGVAGGTQGMQIPKRELLQAGANHPIGTVLEGGKKAFYHSSGTRANANPAANLYAKRVFDIILATVLTIILAPLLLTICLLVATSGMPIIYRHRRIGRHGVAFGCWKFRTMSININFEAYLATHPEAALEWQRNQKLENDPRITAIGKWLRRLSLDELPQLINVLAGDMSLVGPRPVTSSELHRYGANAIDYLSVRPGMTGLWQVSGRNRLSYAERVSVDIQYISNISIAIDLFILLKTIKVLISGNGK